MSLHTLQTPDTHELNSATSPRSNSEDGAAVAAPALRKSAEGVAESSPDFRQDVAELTKSAGSESTKSSQKKTTLLPRSNTAPIRLMTVGKGNSQEDAIRAASHERLMVRTQEAARKLARDLRSQEATRKEKATARRRRNRHLFVSAAEEKELVEEKCGHDSWQFRLVSFIQSNMIQSLLIMMLIIDVLVVMTEVFLDAEYPACSKVVRDAISCMPDTDASGSSGSSSDSSGRRLESSGSGSGSGHVLCANGTVESAAEAACDEHKWADVHVAHTALLAVSIAILFLFLIELTALWVALGADFLRNKLYVLDYLVVFLSLALEIALSRLSEDALAALVGLIIFGRCWRFVRIAHGLATSTHELGHEGHDDHAEQAEGLEKILIDLQHAIAEENNESSERSLEGGGGGGGAHGDHDQHAGAGVFASLTHVGETLTHTVTAAVDRMTHVGRKASLSAGSSTSASVEVSDTWVKAGRLDDASVKSTERV